MTIAACRLTAEQVAKAYELHHHHLPQRRIAEELKVSTAKIQALFDPEYRAKRRAKAARERAKIAAEIRPPTEAAGYDAGRNAADALYDPLRDGPLQIRDFTAAVCGDPPIGRSALDRYRKRENA